MERGLGHFYEGGCTGFVKPDDPDAAAAESLQGGAQQEVIQWYHHAQITGGVNVHSQCFVCPRVRAWILNACVVSDV